MKLLFPNLDTLSLALTSGTIPEGIALSAAQVGYRKSGEILVETEQTVPTEVVKRLRVWNVVQKRTGTVSHPVHSWLQMLPLQKVPFNSEEESQRGTAQTPILFELADNSQLPELVNEMLRLGNDRQSYRWITPEGDAVEESTPAGPMHTLLRVQGPPYYSLLRALERDGRTAAPYAFREQSPRVWVQIGYEHPLARRIKPPVGQILLIQSPRRWRLVSEGKYQDIYQTLDFELPTNGVVWEDQDFSQRLTVPLRLTRGTSHDDTELWVLEENSLAQLDDLVKSAGDVLISQLAFAVVERDEGGPIILLRVRPGRHSPPVLVLNATQYAPYLKLPNLFLPVGMRLHPPLRRDAVKELFAPDPRQLTWLRPEEKGLFTPQSIADHAFRPLEDWVDYVLDRDREALATWVQAMSFQFEPFVCTEDQEEKLKRERERQQKGPRRGKEEEEATEETPQEESVLSRVGKVFRRGTTGKKTVSDKTTQAFTLKEVKPNELQVRLRELEKSFNELPLEEHVPEREDIWREMAFLNAALHQTNDATVCWMNILWDQKSFEDEDLQGWFQTESSREAEDLLSASDLDAILDSPDFSPMKLNSLVAHMLLSLKLDKGVKVLTNRLPKLQQFLEEHEASLSVRVQWLGWRCLYQLADRDELMLARARDRALERLLQHGLSPDRELPSFLRATGVGAGERFRAVKQKVVQLHDAVTNWLGNPAEPDVIRNTNYTHLIFAFGLGRLGVTDRAKELLSATEKTMSLASAGKETNAVHDWLQKAYGYRIQQAISQQPNRGQLPESLLDDLKQLERGQRFVVDRLHGQSEILSPLERYNSFRGFLRNNLGAIEQQLIRLFDLSDKAELAQQISQLLNERTFQTHNPQEQGEILTAALELSPRLGETAALPMLRQVPPVLGRLKETVSQAQLLSKGLHIAAHFDQPDSVQSFVNSFEGLLKDQQKEKNTETIRELVTLLEQSFRALRKLGMRDHINRLLNLMAETVNALHPRGKKTALDVRSPEVLLLMLQVVSGWFYFGQNDYCWPILDEVRDALLSHTELGRSNSQRTPLACAYLKALGQAPVEEALQRIEELFEIDPATNQPRLIQIQDNFFTKDFYSLSKLKVVEALVLALASDDFTLDQKGRKWLDEEEFRIRRRIHHDVRQATMHGAS